MEGAASHRLSILFFQRLRCRPLPHASTVHDVNYAEKGYTDGVMNPQAISEQLQRILESPAFRNSQRYSSFLKYCVEKTLEAQGDSLKERVIGIEVFGRSADYDTSNDHIVRSAASEIRKKLAQYYHLPGTMGEIRIELYPGSYVPQFKLPTLQPVEVPEMTATVESAAPAIEVAVKPSVWRWMWALPAAAIVTVILWYQVPSTTPIDLFWNPVLSSTNPVTFCVGDRAILEHNPEREDLSVLELNMANANWMTFPAAALVAKLSGLFQSKGKQYRILAASRTKFSDFQNGSSIMIGSANNSWTLRFTDSLRFGFEFKKNEWIRIRDRQNPNRLNWSVDVTMPFLKQTQDYALISRIINSTTERPTVIVSGLTPCGTAAAGELMTDPVQINKLLAVAPKGWERKNLQVVLGTDVIDGISGPPKVLAIHVW